MIPAGADRITLCHWNNSGTWESIEVAHSTLNGHSNHELDIWPAVEGVTPGHNWPAGEKVYLNSCMLPVANPSPSESASATATSLPVPSPSLPSTGSTTVLWLLLAVILIAAGLILLDQYVDKKRGKKKHEED